MSKVDAIARARGLVVRGPEVFEVERGSGIGRGWIDGSDIILGGLPVYQFHSLISISTLSQDRILSENMRGWIEMKTDLRRGSISSNDSIHSL